VEIAPGVLQDVSIRGDQVARGVGGGTDLVATLRTLSTALAGNSAPGVRATLDKLSAGITQVASARSRAGSTVNALDVAAAAGKVTGDNEIASSAKLTDADAFDAANRLALANRALEAAISASVSSFRLTLIDKLR
jgi:flagellar hook-associated protein 3 FlgL